jgi:hypothetical protein
MIIPTQFKLMAHTWTVVHHRGMFTAPDGDLCRGYCDFFSLTITVNVDQPRSLVAHTFLHEVMHAVLWSLGNELAENENFVDTVAGALAHVLESSTGCDTTQAALSL